MIQQPPAQPLREIRCVRCGRLLFKAAADGRLEVVCPARDCKVFQAVTLAGRPS